MFRSSLIVCILLVGSCFAATADTTTTTKKHKPNYSRRINLLMIQLSRLTDHFDELQSSISSAEESLLDIRNDLLTLEIKKRDARDRADKAKPPRDEAKEQLDKVVVDYEVLKRKSQDISSSITSVTNQFYNQCEASPSLKTIKLTQRNAQQLASYTKLSILQDVYATDQYLKAAREMEQVKKQIELLRNDPDQKYKVPLVSQQVLALDSVMNLAKINAIKENKIYQDQLKLNENLKVAIVSMRSDLRSYLSGQHNYVTLRQDLDQSQLTEQKFYTATVTPAQSQFKKADSLYAAHAKEYQDLDTQLTKTITARKQVQSDLLDLRQERDQCWRQVLAIRLDIRHYRERDRKQPKSDTIVKQ